MKFPKTKKVYCKTCKKHSEHKITQVKIKGRSSTHPLSWGSTKRRGGKSGVGNHGKYSKPPTSKFKRTGAKTSKKTALKETCQECKKASIYTAKRAKKVELE